MKVLSPAEAQAFCTAYTKHSGSNFYYSFLFLPRPRREAMYTIYTFCRMVDTAVDEPAPGSNITDVLAGWREEVSATYKGHPTLPVTMSLASHLQHIRIPEHLFQELISGVEMDVTLTRYHTFSDLYPYCYRVASVVGLICLKIFNTQSPAAEEYAINLGLAFQLTNILRDVHADARQNRIYLPLEDFQSFGYSEDALLNRQWSPALADLMTFECARAKEYYQKAQDILQSLPVSDQKALVVAEIMRGVYSRILGKFEAENFPVFGPRISVSPIHRLSIAVSIWLRCLWMRRLAPSV